MRLWCESISWGGAAHPEALEGSSGGCPRTINPSRPPHPQPTRSPPPSRGSARDIGLTHSHSLHIPVHGPPPPNSTLESAYPELSRSVERMHTPVLITTFPQGDGERCRSALHIPTPLTSLPPVPPTPRCPPLPPCDINPLPLPTPPSL